MTGKSRPSMSITTPEAGMQRGSDAAATGGLSEKRVVNFTANYFRITSSEVLIRALTPDASTRKYYRVASSAKPSETLIISLYPSPFNQQDNSFIDVTSLFERAGLPVPRILAVADTVGIILQEDLGDMSLSRWLSEAEERGDAGGSDEMIRQAIEMIVRIQSATTLAYAINSVASRYAFDESKLSWEMNYFFTHYFSSYRRNVAAGGGE
jgi:aminoglycoside/choline kinase family phosphotransferase